MTDTDDTNSQNTETGSLIAKLAKAVDAKIDALDPNHSKTSEYVELAAAVRELSKARSNADVAVILQQALPIFNATIERVVFDRAGGKYPAPEAEAD